MRELEREPNADPRDIPVLAIVGAGRVGHAIHRSARAAGLDVRLAGRDDMGEACEQAEVALLCVPDTAIEDACATIANAIPPLRFVGHTSGSSGAQGLRAASAAGAATFGLHPLQTVPDGAAELAHAPCAVSGSDGEAVTLAASLARRLGMRPFALEEEQRAAYHAAASIASNFLVALEESAAELLERAGIEDPRELLTPLVLRSAVNWADRGPAALTGPIARGDVATVKRHLEAIAELAPQLGPLYEVLAERTRSLAARQTGAAEVAP